MSVTDFRSTYRFAIGSFGAAHASVEARFARRLQQMRRDRGLSAGELAHLSGLTLQEVFAIETQQTEVTLELLSAVAFGLSVSITVLLQGV
jgi:transcriptional regulator with XRE-family HTH domain